MQFSGEANGLDLYSDCRYLCGLDETTDTTTYPIKAFTRNANLGLDRTNALILKADGWNMPYDDTNQTGELLDITQTFVTGTQKISLQSTWFIIGRVRITDANGNWITLPEMPRKAQTDTQLTMKGGVPNWHFILGNYLYFDRPTTFGGTLEVQFQRGPSYFAYTDTTKTPGFAPQFHRLISLYGAQDYCETNYLPDRAATVRARIGSPPDLLNNQPGSGLEKELVDFYSRRDRDMKTSLTVQREDFGQLGLNPGSGSYPTSWSPYGF